MKHIELPDLLMRELKHIFPILDLVKNGIVITNEHSKILYVNETYSILTGYTKTEVIGQNPGIIRSGHHSESFYKDMWNKINVSGFWEGEIWNRNKSGRVFPTLLTISKIKDQSSTNVHYIGVLSDITLLEVDNTEKINLAFYDALTKLPNRLSLEENYNKIILAYKRSKFEHAADKSFVSKVAFIFFDLNTFKLVNDQHGHVVGDKLLKMIAERLQGMTRGTDIIARYGGDEFVAILSDVKNGQDIDNFCKRINEVFAIPFSISGLEISSSCSIGVSIYPDDADDFEFLIDKADKAMYKAKMEWRESNI